MKCRAFAASARSSAATRRGSAQLAQKVSPRWPIGATMTFSRTVISGNGRGIWKVRASPMRKTRSGGSPSMRSPSRRSRPEVGGIRPGEAVEERRLAGAVRPDQSGDRAPLDRERDAVDGAVAPEAPGDRLRCEHGRRVGAGSACCRGGDFGPSQAFDATALTPRVPVRDDSFELYDLKVEVVAPEGATIHCGAKPGDYLRAARRDAASAARPGLLDLFARGPSAAAAGKAEADAIRTTGWRRDAEVACPDPNCPTRFRITRTGRRTLPPRGGDGGAAAARGAHVRWASSGSSLRPATRSRGSSAAAGSSPAATAPSTRERAVADMQAFLDAGVTTFDCADIYTGVEELIGALPRRLRRNGPARTLSPASRCTPSSCRTWSDLRRVDAAYVRGIVERSLRRLGQERLDLVQFHWWDYDIPGCGRRRSGG